MRIEDSAGDPVNADLRVGQVRANELAVRGRSDAWDVNNAMLDGGFYEEPFGSGTNARFFKQARRIDPDMSLFVNEFMVLEEEGKTERYLELVEDLKAKGAPVGGIGIQDHFAAESAGERDPDKVFQNLDRVAELGLPIHITELSFQHEETRAEALEMRFCSVQR